MCRAACSSSALRGRALQLPSLRRANSSYASPLRSVRCALCAARLPSRRPAALRSSLSPVSRVDEVLASLRLVLPTCARVPSSSSSLRRCVLFSAPFRPFSWPLRVGWALVPPAARRPFVLPRCLPPSRCWLLSLRRRATRSVPLSPFSPCVRPSVCPFARGRPRKV